MNTPILFFVSSFFILLSVGCRYGNHSDILAEVDGVVITRAEIDRTAGKPLQNLRQQIYELEKQKLDEYIGATLLTQMAKEQGVSVSTLLEREVSSKIGPISDDEVRNIYEKNKDRFRIEFDKVRDQLRNYLHEQKVTQRKNEYFSSLRAKAKIKTYLMPPPVQRVSVRINDAPNKGTVNALIKVVKFEDFQCPYCKMVQPRFGELLKKYEGKIEIIHKDLPLESIHPQARQAAEAARCAAEQGKFWEYHDRLYLRSPKLSADDLKAYANDVGLNRETFDGCFTSGKHKAAVQKDLMEGADLGITGTPTFFINGRELTGGQSLEAFSAIIDEELALAK
jgi:protein-disulfide isomerase